MNSPTCCGWKGFLRKTIARSLLLCLFWSLAVCGNELQAQTAVPENVAKAAILAKFPDFVKWPAASGSSITFGILGDDPFSGALDSMVKVKRSRRVEDLKGCQIVFIPKSGNVGGALSSLAGMNVLTVGESDGFAKQGGIIGFVIEGDKVRFEINTGAATRAGININSRLLKLAIRTFSS
ncbi:MAG: hypothetical protein QOE70_5663 [Chthoniobacter sp.]|nr:hypothetical protein [Chthoniobacter sp.]